MSVKTIAMRCIDNSDYENRLTVGSVYSVEIEKFPNGDSMKMLEDNNGDFLQTMLDRFEEV